MFKFEHPLNSSLTKTQKLMLKWTTKGFKELNLFQKIYYKIYHWKYGYSKQEDVILSMKLSEYRDKVLFLGDLNFHDLELPHNFPKTRKDDWFDSVDMANFHIEESKFKEGKIINKIEVKEQSKSKNQL